MTFNTSIAIISIAVLEIVAIIKGLNGILLASAIAVIAGLGGFYIGKTKKS